MIKILFGILLIMISQINLKADSIEEITDNTRKTNIWIIGASEGIGRALSIELAKDQNNFLILSARNKERLEEVAKELKTPHIIAPLDVRNKESVMSGWQIIKKHALEVDKIIYCAGYYQPMSADDIKIDEVESMIDINLTGAIRVFNMVIPEFINKQAGSIVLIGSLAGYRGMPNSLGYGASKAGIMHLAENLRYDIAKHNIEVQIINPGFVRTRLTDLNSFKMPFIMEPTEAAKIIVQKMQAGHFESSFPFLFSSLLKFISLLPDWIYFRIL